MNCLQARKNYKIRCDDIPSFKELNPQNKTKESIHGEAANGDIRMSNSEDDGRSTRNQAVSGTNISHSDLQDISNFVTTHVSEQLEVVRSDISKQSEAVRNHMLKLESVNKEMNEKLEFVIYSCNQRQLYTIK